MTDTKKAAKGFDGFSADERSAMKDHAEELKKSARRGAKASQADGEADALEKITAMPDSDRALAERIHAIVKDAAPDLQAKTWYGMPAYAKDGKNVCFFQSAHKFKSRFAMLGFTDQANLDDGNVWPVYYALTTLTADDEARLAALIKQAAS